VALQETIHHVLGLRREITLSRNNPEKWSCNIMGRITPVITDGLEKRLRDYISVNYAKAYGGITKVIEEALTDFLDGKETS
jgi:hypothetical protein